MVPRKVKERSEPAPQNGSMGWEKPVECNSGYSFDKNKNGRNQDEQ